MQTGAPDPPVVQGETVISQSDVCPRGPESWSRRPVEAEAEAQGMETSCVGRKRKASYFLPYQSIEYLYSEVFSLEEVRLVVGVVWITQEGTACFQADN